MTEERYCLSDDDDTGQELSTVVDIERFIIDPAFVQRTQLKLQNIYDAYDITVTGGKYLRKLVLSPHLNHIIQKRQLCAGSQVSLRKVNMRYDEASLTAQCIPVIEDLVVVEQLDVNVTELRKLPWHPHDGKHQQESCPLASDRSYYVDLWCDADVAGVSDDYRVQRSRRLEIASSDLYSLREVVRGWQKVKAAKPRLLLRVMRRAKLIHYARPNVREKWPFQLWLTVGDETGCCVAVFWNAMAVRFVSQLQEGDIILLRNFAVKPRFQIPEHPVWQPHDLPWFDVDININMHHPVAEVTVVAPSALDSLHNIDLPLPITNFITRRQLGGCPDGFQCDVAGLVTFVGVVQREKMKGKPGSDRFWIKRWVHLEDNTSRRTIIVQLFRGVQKEEFEDLTAGMFLVCRNMRTMHSLESMENSREPRCPYLTSTRDTQVYVSEVDEDMDYPFAVDVVVESAQQFAASHDVDTSHYTDLFKLLFTYPPQPTMLDAFCSRHDNLQLTASDDWEEFVDRLRYRESAHLDIQARLVGVSFHRGRGSTARKTRGKHKRQNRKSIAGSSRGDDVKTLGLDLTSDDVVDASESSFFVLKWKGLNVDVVLNSVKEVRLGSCPRNLSLEAFLSGTHDISPGDNVVEIREDVVRKMATWDVSNATRFLVVLDAFCVDGDSVVFGLNRAFPAPGL